MNAVDRFLLGGFGRCLCHSLDLLFYCGEGYGLRNSISYSLSLWERVGERVLLRNPQICSSVFESQALTPSPSPKGRGETRISHIPCHKPSSPTLLPEGEGRYFEISPKTFSGFTKTCSFRNRKT